MTRREAVDWFRRELERRDTGDDETGAYTLAVTALLRSIRSTRAIKKKAIRRAKEARPWATAGTSGNQAKQETNKKGDSEE